MFFFLCSSFCLGVGTYFAYKANTFSIIKEQVEEYKERYISLTNLVSKTKKTRIGIFLTSVKLIIQTIYASFLQYMNSNVRKLDKRTYEISYVIEGRIYRLVVTPRRGPTPIIQVIDNNDNDLTSKVLPYMGPQYDWHGNAFTPEFFNCTSLTFELADGSEHTYTGKTTVQCTPRK